MTTAIQSTAQLGQSIWYDQLNRSILESGELKRMIQEDGLLGMTTNPSIFEKSISSGKEYESSLKTFAEDGKLALEIYEELVLEDVSRAADIFRPVYETTNGKDGYVSIEVNPELAHDTNGTVSEAKRLFSTLKRPNIMIKVPATPEGLPAIEELIFSGINVNVTLIFSIEVYEKVADAYINGITRRISKKKPVDKIHSVASFFVSRIDTAIDKIIESKNILSELRGKSAVANARLAYAKFKSIFGSDNFKRLGANLQRPLWASTGTKNPNYSDVKYVEELIGEDTVNTIPPATYKAFLDHGKVKLSIENNLEEMKTVIAQLNQEGINIEEVTAQLAKGGVNAFVDSFKNLISIIEKAIK